jgi:hypothetical protein
MALPPARIVPPVRFAMIPGKPEVPVCEMTSVRNTVAVSARCRARRNASLQHARFRPVQQLLQHAEQLAVAVLRVARQVVFVAGKLLQESPHVRLVASLAWSIAQAEAFVCWACLRLPRELACPRSDGS